MKVRIQVIDILRGTAAFLMILAHSFVIFGANETYPLYLFSKYTDVVAYTTFVFMSGAAGYIATINTALSPQKIKKKYKKIFKMLLIYYLAAMFVMLYYLDSNTLSNVSIEIIRILVFFNLPAYTEFFLSLIIYALIMLAFKNQLKTILKNNTLLIILLMTSYLLGQVAYSINTSHFLTYYKSILFGESDWYRFPIFQYFPVLLIGLKWGQLITQPKASIIKITAKIFASFTLLTLFILTLNYFNILQTQILRWPPSILFLLIGLTFITIAIILFETLNKYFAKILLLNVLRNIGQIALGVYVVHIFILFSYRLLYDKILSNPVIIIVLAFVVLILSFLITKLIAHVVSKNEKKEKN